MHKVITQHYQSLTMQHSASGESLTLCSFHPDCALLRIGWWATYGAPGILNRRLQNSSPKHVSIVAFLSMA